MISSNPSAQVLSYKAVAALSLPASSSSSSSSYKSTLNEPPVDPHPHTSDAAIVSKKAVYKEKTEVKRVDQALTNRVALDSFESELRAYRPDPYKVFKYYNGRISTRCGTKPQYMRIRDIADQVLFSQKTVSDTNYSPKDNCDYPIDDLADALFMEFKRNLDRSGDGALDIVHMREGLFTSVDNRRLLIAKKIGRIDRFYGIWVRVHQADEPLSSFLQKRFDGAETWGEAVRNRIGDTQVDGYSRYPIIMTVNRLDQRVRADSQKIPLTVKGYSLSELHPDDVAQIRRNRVKGIIYI